MATALFGVFFLFLLFGLPIAFSIMLGAFFGVIQSQALPLMLVPQRMLIASDNFSMLAIPLFILAGDLMNTGGITHRMVTFAYTIVGHIRGGLGITSITASMIFAGISGSAVADTAAVGALLIPSMVEKKIQARLRGNAPGGRRNARAHHPAEHPDGALRFHHQRVHRRPVPGRHHSGHPYRHYLHGRDLVLRPG